TTILLGAAMFFLPGYALLALVNPRLETDPVERFSLAVGLSLAVIPLSLYLSTLAGIRQGPTYLALFLGAAGLVTMWDFYRRWRTGGFEPLRRHWMTIGAFAIIALSALVARLLGVAGLEFPLWTDSYHHTLIAQIIADHGLVPSSYEPYAPIHEFSYHFGFHTLVAWFHWLTRTPIPRSVIVVGQVVNALVVPTTYVLAKRLWKKPLIGLIAGGILGLFSHMPAFFVNWGRYTQLAGQILFPVALALWIEALEQETTRVRKSLLSGIVLSGLFLLHNRVMLFALVFIGLTFVQAVVVRRVSHKSLRPPLVTAIIILGTALVIDLNWILNFINVYGIRVLGMVEAGYSQSVFGQYFMWSLQYFVDYGASVILWIMAAFGLMVGIFKKDKGVLLLAVGTTLLLMLAMTYLVGVTPLFTVLIITIWLYLPVGLLCGYFLEQLYQFGSKMIWQIKRVKPLYFRMVLLSMLLIACLPTIPAISELTLPENGFITEADLSAMDWIRVHVPQNSLFYISTHFWTPHLAHGLDAGYWIPYFTRRQTILPPEPYSSDGSVDQMNSINDRARAILSQSNVEDLYQELLNYQVTHVYIGKRQSYLNPDQFLEYPQGFELLYDVSDVWIFKVLGQSTSSPAS
ncbi:MAG: DUF1616 domain-containing protein, partial [Lysobacterales bacterium]